MSGAVTRMRHRKLSEGWEKWQCEAAEMKAQEAMMYQQSGLEELIIIMLKTDCRRKIHSNGRLPRFAVIKAREEVAVAGAAAT